jgi:hypothetical protein
MYAFDLFLRCGVCFMFVLVYIYISFAFLAMHYGVRKMKYSIDIV